MTDRSDGGGGRRLGRTTGGTASPAHASRSAVGGQLLVLGVLLAVFALWVVPGLSNHSHGAASGDDATEAASDGATHGERRPGDEGSPPPDRAREAYQAVGVGDCLAGDRPGGADEALPTRVACEAGEAFHRVTRVTDRTGGCPSGPGLSDWYHIDTDGTTTALCLERTFRAGDCFAASRSEAPGAGRGYAVDNADLRSPLPCRGSPGRAAERLPESYNAVMVITEVRSVRRQGAGRDDGRSCDPEPGDVRDHWYWVVNRGTVVVCAAFVEE